MDPTVALEEIRQLVNNIQLRNSPPWPLDIDRLTELIEALDNWINNGGCFPEQWRK